MANDSKSEEAKVKTAASSQPEDAAEEAPDEKKHFWTDNKVEILVAILLGITALLMAWASWIGSLHSGVQAINFTKSNNLASEGNSEYNAGVQLYLSDMMTWNALMDYSFDLTLAEAENDEARVALLTERIQTYAEQNASEILLEGIEWMNENGEDSPFKKPGLIESYFSSAVEKLTESQELLEEGQRDNANGDAYNLVSVIYSLILFLLGIVGIFKRLPNRVVILTVALVGLILATVYMCTLPMPTGFDPASFFAPK